MEKADKLLNDLCALLPEADGFECHRFKIGSYNALVAEDFRLLYEEDVMGVVVLNTPSFLETTFKRWLQSKAEGKGVNTLIEKFGASPMQAYFLEKFKQIRQDLQPEEVDVIQDFDFTKKWVPKVLLTTCGMVAGAAHFYRPAESDSFIIDPVTHVQKRRMGLSLHPKFGGHFGYRAVFIFPRIHLPATFKSHKAPILLDSTQKQDEALDLFNNHWMDGRFRDCGDPVERYSDLQLKFFSTVPMERWALIAHWFEESSARNTA